MKNLEVRKVIFKDEFLESMGEDFSDTKFLRNVLSTLFADKIDLKELSEILDQPIDIDGNTALHIVAAKGDQKLTKLFVQYGAQIDVKNKLGRTPLDVAKSENVTLIGKALNTLSLGYTDYRDTTKVQGVIKDTAKTVTKLQSMARGIGVKQELKSVKAAKIIFRKALEEKPLNYNLIKGTIKAIHDKFGQGVLKDVLDHPLDDKGNTALHIAALSEDIDLIKTLMQNGANIEVKNKKGNTPETEIIRSVSPIIDVFDNVRDRDLIVEVLSDKQNKIASNKKVPQEVMEDLIHHYRHNVNKSKPEVDIFIESSLLKLQEISKTEDFQANPLKYLGGENLEELEKVLHGQKDKNNPLYQPGAAGWVNYYDHDGYIQKAIDSAKEILQVTQGFEEKINKTVILEKFKKDLTSSDLSVVDKSLEGMDPEMSQYVLSQPIDQNGNTALHIAAAKGNKKLAEVLVMNGANLTSKNKSGDTPEEVAAKNQRTFIGRLANYPDTDQVRGYLLEVDNIIKKVRTAGGGVQTPNSKIITHNKGIPKVRQ